MGDKTGISWTDSTWCPFRGCRRVSAGCENCYAEAIAGRFCGPGLAYEGLARRVLKTAGASQPRWTGDTRFVVERLADPLRWRAPRRIFVNSTSDTFYDGFTDEQIDQVFGVMALAPQHIFQVLTKRPERMQRYFTDENVWPRIEVAARKILFERKKIRIGGKVLMGPLPHIWIGTSVENQDAADQRIPWLLLTPAAVRFLSCEPLLGPVDLHGIQIPGEREGLRFSSLQRHHDDRFGGSDTTISWVIAGCESGRGARECKVEWLRALRDQCAAAGVPYFLKQAEESVDLGADQLPQLGDDDSVEFGDGSKLKGKGPRTNVVELPYLDGVQHAAFPAVAP